MKTALRYLIFLLIPFLSSCWENHYDNIPEDQKPELVNNDTLLFVDSLTNIVDTFNIYFSNYYDISDSRYYTELINIGYILNNQNSFYTIRQHFKGIFIGVNTKTYDPIYFEENKPKPAQQDLLVRGVTYPNTYVLNQYRFDTDTLPKTVYYSLKHGIIRYDYADGRKYELVSE
ncbi:MAG: hypothetical protein JXR27_07405 [Paludibacteraceae bacterium]|nr:hypothetical protein [Paludibacteraceae bacterium]